MTLVLLVVATAVLGKGTSEPLAGWVRSVVEEVAGPRVVVQRVGLDPFLVRGVRLEGVRLEQDGWRFEAPVVWVRPHWRGLLAGRLAPAAHAPRFTMTKPARTRPSALALLPPRLEAAARRAGAITLSHGVIRHAGGAVILAPVRATLSSDGARLRVRLRGAQPGGGRVEARGELGGPAGRIRVSLDEIHSRDLRAWLASDDGALEQVGAGPWPARTSGAWRAERGARAGRWVHRFSLGAEADEPSWAGRTTTPSELWTARAEGALFLDARAAGRPPGAAAHPRWAGWALLSGELGRLRTLALASGGRRRVVASGPLVGLAVLSGVGERPSVALEADLGEALVGVEQWLYKPVGHPARLRLSTDPASGSLRARVDVGELGLDLERDGLGVLTLRSGWWDAAALARLCPRLEDVLTAGGIRLATLRHHAGEPVRARVEARGLAVRTPPFDHPVVVSGALRMDGPRIESQDVVAWVNETRLALEASAGLPHPGDRTLRLRVALRTPLLVASAAPDAPRPESRAVGVPPALVAAVEPILRALRSVRSDLEEVEVESVRFDAARVVAGGERVDDLRLRARLHALELAVEELSFRAAGRRHRLAGAVDLARFVPEIRLVALPAGPARAPAALDPTAPAR